MPLSSASAESMNACDAVSMVLAMFSANALANSRFSIFSTEEIVAANGTQTLLGNGFRLVSTKDKIIFNGYDITDLIHYIQYSNYSCNS